MDRPDQRRITRPAELGFWRRFALRRRPYGIGLSSARRPSAVPNEIFSDGSYSSTYCNASYESSNLFGLIPTGTMTDNVCATLNSYGAGFNADTNFDLQYSDTTSEDRTLTLVTAPEPATVVLFSGVLALLALRRFPANSAARPRDCPQNEFENFGLRTDRGACPIFVACSGLVMIRASDRDIFPMRAWSR